MGLENVGSKSGSIPEPCPLMTIWIRLSQRFAPTPMTPPWGIARTAFENR